MNAQSQDLHGKHLSVLHWQVTHQTDDMTCKFHRLGRFLRRKILGAAPLAALERFGKCRNFLENSSLQPRRPLTSPIAILTRFLQASSGKRSYVTQMGSAFCKNFPNAGQWHCSRAGLLYLAELIERSVVIYLRPSQI